MGLYRKKPVEVEAWQWLFTTAQEEPPDWIEAGIVKLPYEVGAISFEPEHESGPRLLVHTLEGQMTCRPGSWIIRGVNGELYPCQDDIFRRTYELVEVEAA